jgi:hypothetical protein
MPDGSFNIAVAPFSGPAGQENAVDTTEAVELSNGITKYISEQSAGEPFLVYQKHPNSRKAW